MIAPLRKQANGGTILPQFSLRDYFAAINAIQNQSLDTFHAGNWCLPVRRFNPASLITPSGRSLIGQLMKVTRAIVIEDLDVEPDHLKQHYAQFGLPGTAAVFCDGDGFRTEANYYVITCPAWADHLTGRRLW